MAKIRQLAPSASIFIGGEMPNVYQHTAGLVILEGTDAAGLDYDKLRRHVEQHVGKIPHFRWRLHEVPLGLDLPYWVEDENFDFDHHIHRVALPSPGDDRALAEVCSYIYGRHLDRARPLWEIWFIEGLAGGRYALLQKTHHCVIDGEGAAKLAELLWDFKPDAKPKEVGPEIANARPGEVPEQWRQSLNTFLHLSTMSVNLGRELYGLLGRSITGRWRGEPESPRITAPDSRFNGDIGSDRGLAFGSLSLELIKAIKNHFHVTVNDVLLALVGGSIREYLLAEDQLPQSSLRTAMAVSLRTEEDEEFSNRVTTTSVTLGTDLADPEQRLRAIAQEADRAKERAHHGGKGVLEYMQMLPPALVNVLMHLTPAERVPEIMGVNIIVSNLRGSERPLYMGHARVAAIYPMSIINPGGGLNITCLSYAGRVHFGLTCDPDLVPDPWRLFEGVERSLAGYSALAGKSKRRRTRKKAKPVSG